MKSCRKVSPPCDTENNIDPTLQQVLHPRRPLLRGPCTGSRTGRPAGAARNGAGSAAEAGFVVASEKCCSQELLRSSLRIKLQPPDLIVPPGWPTQSNTNCA